MSCAVMAYAVDLEELKKILRSGWQDLKLDDDVSDDLSVAYRELIDGLNTTRNEQNYVDVFELLCRQFGRLLPNDGLSPICTSHFDNVNEVLKSYQLGFDLKQVVYGGIPIDHPILGKSSSLGYVSAEILSNAIKLLDGKSIESEDAEIDDALFNIENWLEIAVARKLDIVGFFY